MTICTIIARNYLAHARVLAASLARHDPDASLSVLIIDARPGEITDEPFDVLTAADLDIEPAEYRRMALIYSVLELATAVKPWLLQTLLDRGAASVLYLDPDIELHASIAELGELAETQDIVLTPHTLAPMRRDERTPSETDILLAGVYNLGFVGVGPGASPFLRWWRDRLRRDCVSDVASGLFVDQRWIDFVPGYWRHAIVRDPGYNVAYWNLPERPLTRDASGAVYAAGQPLRFFHFSGFDPTTPHVVSKYPGATPRVVMSDSDVLADLYRDYAVALRAAGYDAGRDVPYRYERTASGLRLDVTMRAVARAAIKELEANDDDPTTVPDPFDPATGDAFVHWLNERDPAAPRFTRYLVGLHRVRPDIGFAFHDLRGPDGDRYQAWLLDPNRPEPEIPAELLAPLGAEAPRAEPQNSYARGVNVAGYVRAESGVGEGARLLVNALERAGIGTSVVPVKDEHNREQAPFERADAVAPFDVSIIAVNADQLPRFAGSNGAFLLDGRYTIGMWAWEVEEFPAPFWGSADFVDEIWMGSRHSAAAVARHVSKPVLSFPLPVVPPDVPPIDRRRLGMPNGFTFLFCFDFASVAERKNPLGLIEAFRRAFAPGEGPTLLIKTVNGSRHLLEQERVRAAAADRPDIVIRDGYISAGEQYALMAAADAYVSLHRAEGFGLTMAEAMALKKPVIATAYSGNLEYMDERNSFLVPATLVPVGDGHDPYPVTARWAEPDVDVAADHLRRVFRDPREAAARASRAADDIRRRHGPEAAAPFLLARLDVARRVRPKPAPLPQPVEALLSGPDVLSSTNRGVIAHSFRRGVLRVLRHYTEHREKVDRAILERVAEVEQKLQVGLANLQLGAEQRFDVLEGRENQLTRDVAEIRDEIEAAPYLSEPGDFFTTDDEGREVLGYRGAKPTSGVDRYRALEDAFRGPEQFVRARLEPYVELLRGHQPVLDLGCGRGELLDALAAAGIKARGVDIDEGMVARSQAKGHDVELADGRVVLESAKAASLGAVVSAQVIEHLAANDLIGIIEASHRALRPGGLFIAETVNPHSSRALKAFWLDLTHVHPVFPEMALALCRAAGFEEATILFPNGTGKLDIDRVTAGEYAVIARKG